MVVPLLARSFESLGFVTERSWVSVTNESSEGKRQGGFGWEEENGDGEEMEKMDRRTAFEKNLAIIKRRGQKVITVLGRATLPLHNIRDGRVTHESDAKGYTLKIA
ncbi:unnamed protein product [Sphenostylis stenocarpa]|uniref:Uncharacterized protein n=1 Tax=Sphenostylis stenocarpa TaxID=92480 RepID=A0AA86RXS4_9FABA|nr:unnamed protein product [Sphenostylis stenocarpa]